MRRFFSLVPFFIYICFVFLLAGCATSEYPMQVTHQRKGIYHKVKKGETVWRLSKTYDVSIDDIIVANNIRNVSSVKVNQKIFIPGARQKQEVSVVFEY